MQDFLTKYLFVLLSAFTTFALPILLRYLWQKSAAIHDLRLRQYAIMLASAAQQLIPATSERYDWVSSALAARFRYLTAAQIQQLIESAVHSVKVSGSATVTPPVVLPPVPIVTADIDLTSEPKAGDPVAPPV